MWAMRAHHFDFDQAKITQTESDPWNKHPNVSFRNTDPAQNEGWKSNQKEAGQIFPTKMTLQYLLKRAGLAIFRSTCRLWLIGI